VAVSRTIVVAGAGIGGLTAALALARRGFRVIVLEKAERLEETGAGLQLSPNASRVLIDLGLEPRLAGRAVTPDAISLMSAQSGGEIARLPLGDAATFRAGAPYWIVHRADLQSALLAQVGDNPGIELRLGCQFEDAAAHAKGISVGQRRGISRQQDTALALVGADGVWSQVRHQLFPQTQPAFSGLIAWRGTIDATQLPRELAPRRVQLWMGPAAHLVAYPISGGRQINVVAILPGTWNRPGWSEPGSPNDIKDQFSQGWPGALRMMIGAVDDWRRWALFTLRDGGVWSSGPMALLGDAAHAMLPFAAQGAGMAIEDAAVLAQCLSENSGDTASSIATSLQRYAGSRRSRVARVQSHARQMGRIYHLGGPMAYARDLFIKSSSPQRLLARQDWIYDWRV
jgi:2-polyprenyl-6-methoxyphenol hydroxylase-like FAD-dependent oxidoreductase